MPRNAPVAAYRWATETAAYAVLRDMAAIDSVPQNDAARFLFEVMYPIEEDDCAKDHEIAEYFGFDDYAIIPRQWVLDFVKACKIIWRDG